MTKVTVLNDLHLGCARQGGTTPQSRAELKVWQYEMFEGLLAQADDHLIINGDLFDGFAVDPMDVILTFNAFADWLHGGVRTLTLSAGNHDWSAKGGKTSSFHLLAHFLRSQFQNQVEVIDFSDGLTRVTDNIWVLPHVANQDLFDLEINKAMEADGRGWLLLHANYQNTFAQHSDHSLNVSQDQIDRLLSSGWNVLFGHEHIANTHRGGRVLVAGNQLVTSIADCIECSDKWFTRIEEDGAAKLELVMKVSDVFAQVDWRDLTNAPATKFIRVTGEATAEEAAGVVDAVARLRQNSDSYVIANAVRVAGVEGFTELTELSLEAITSFNVMDALLAELTEKEGKVIKELMA